MLQEIIKRTMNKVLRLLLKLPLGIKLRTLVCKWLGINCLSGGKISRHTLIGDYHNLYLHNNAEINVGCFLLAKEKIEIGENSTLAYGVMILTSVLTDRTISYRSYIPRCPLPLSLVKMYGLVQTQLYFLELV